jgi:hypothetical protein
MLKVSIKSKELLSSAGQELDDLVLEVIAKNSYCFSELLNFFVPKAFSQPEPFLISQLCKL